MENKFTITDPEKKLLVSIQFENDVNPNDKKKLQQMIITALDLWEATETFSNELDKVIQSNVCKTPNESTTE
jgi:hypothetical protein